MRVTGKTFRMLLRAVADASEGFNVLYACPTSQAADYTFRMAREISRPAYPNIRHFSARRFISFETCLHKGGWLEIITYNQLDDDSRRITRGIKNLKVVTD